MSEDDVSMANWHLSSVSNGASFISAANSIQPSHAMLDFHHVQLIIAAKYDMIISFDDLARQFSQHFPNHFRLKRYIPFRSGGD